MTETIKRLRFPRLRFPVPVVTTLALLVILAAVALSGTAQAQTAITLVSNIGQAEATLSRNPVGQPIGLQFTTGDNAAGYNLDSVEIAVGDYENVVVTVSLYSDSSGEPGSSIFNFTNPTSGITADAVNTFTAPENTTLAGSNTPYFIVFDGANDPDESTNRIRIKMTHTNDEDSGGATNAEGDADWEIADISHALDSGVWYGDDTDELKIRLKGSAKSGGDTPTVSTDATLSALSLGTGVTLSPAFDADTYAYTASVANSVDEVTVTASTTDTDATFEYLDESDATLDDEDTNAAGHQVDLDVGDTVFKVKVTAADDTTTQTYTVTVTRAACTLNEGDIWCGVMDVGTITNSGGATQSHGFQGTTGDLSDKTFSLMFETGTTNNYTITAIVVGATSANSEELYFVTSSSLTDTEVESLALHVDGESDPFVWSDSTEVITGSYRWPARTDLDWSSETTVTLRLREFPRPTVTNVEVTSTPMLETDTYGAGETIEVSVTFSEAVDATSDTDFVLSVGGARRAPLVDGSGTATLVFGYTVVSSDEDTNGIWIGDETRTLVGNRNGEAQNGTITSVATGAAAVIAHTLLGTDSDHKVDGSRSDVAPTLSIGNASGTEGGAVTFTVTLSAAAAADVTATWTASIGTGDTAVAGDLGTKTGTAFVAMGVTTGTFDVPTAEDSTEEADETFTVTLSGVSSNAQLAADPTAKGTIIDDDTAPEVDDVEVTSTPVLESDTYGAGETIEVSVTFSEAVDATSDTDFVLSVAGGKRAPLVSGSGTATLVFGYTVADDDADDNGIWIGDETGTLVGNRGGEPQNGAITSVANAAAADIDHAELGTQSGHKVDGTRSIVSVEVTSDPSLEMDTYGAGETIQFTVTFNVPVDVDGDPVLEFLFDGSEVRQAGDVSGSGTTELVFGYTVVSGDDDDNGLYIRDESDYNNPDGPVRLDSNDAIEFKDTSTDVPLYWQGRGTQSGHKVDGSRTTGNNPPSFTTSATLSIPENTGRLTVVAEDSDTDDDITGYAITGGADNSHFSSVSSSGELQFVNDPNFENPQDSGADNTYEVTVQATSGTSTREMTATRTFTVTVTDVAEQSAKPDKPTLAAVSGSSTSLTATWEAPDKNGGPAITGYDLQYRAGATGTWSSSTSYGATVTTATITGLTADTSYQARVLAKNGETDSDWSDASDAVSTNAAVAMMPLDVLVSNYPEGSGSDYSLNFHSTVGANQRHYFTQTFTAGAGFTLTAVDIPFTSVPDNSRVTVSLHARNGSKPGTYLGNLDLSGALAVGDNTFAAPAGTALASGTYFVRVRWRDGDTDNLRMTDGPDDETSAESGWSIEDRSQYSASGSSWSNWNQQFAMRVRGTIDGVPRVATGGVRIESDPDAHDSYGVGEEIEVAVGFTDDVTVDTTSGTPRVALTVGSNTRYADYSASDSSADELAFVYEVTADDHDQNGVSIDADALELNGGAIHKDGDTSTNAVLDHAALDADSDHRVNRDPIIVSDGVSVISDPQAATDTYGLGEVIEIEVEFSAAVDATTNTDFVLSVAGAKRAPLLRGSGTKKLVFGYTVVASDDDDDGIWIGEQDRTLVGNRNGEPQNGEITSAVTDRAADLDHDSPGVLSDHKVDGSRTTDNVAPSFTSLATFDAAENQTAAGTVVAADSDSDDSVTGYEITGGADQALFEIGATSGELTFKSAPNFEDPQDTDTGNDYEVTVQATSGTDTREMTADQTITVTVTDVDTEAPGKPGTPTVSAGSATSLRVNWSAPSNAGPPITGYDVRHRTSSPEGSWTEKNVPSIAAVIDNLSENTSYDVQVRAINHEGTGAWSDSGNGTTDAAASDDCLDDNTTTCEVDVGGSVTGTLETAGDSDWFKVVLEAGTRYQIDLEGADTGRGTLPNPGAILYNRSSANVAFDVNGGVGDNARVIYTPTAAGAHYVQANTASGTGTYTLSVIVLGANGNSEADTDFPNNNTTTGRVEVGASVTGNVESANDVDRFRVDLEADKEYQFDLEGAPTGRGTLPDPALSFADATGTVLEYDDNDGDGVNSQIVYTPTATGVYYLRPHSRVDTETGTYTLSVREVPTAVLPTLSIVNKSETEGSLMVFPLSLSEATSENVAVTCTATFGGGDTAVAEDLTFTSANGGVRSGQVVGICSFRSVQDTIVEEDETFTVTLSGVSSNAQLATDPTAKGTILDDDDPPVDDSETEEDDLAADTTTTGTVEVGGAAVRGDIFAPEFSEGDGPNEVDGWDFDTDWFEVDLEADKTYRIDMWGHTTANGLTLRLPQINAIYDSKGSFIVNTWYSDESDSHYLFRVTFTASSNRSYYIAASGESFEWGTYKLWVKDITEDDHGDHGDEGDEGDGTNGGKGLKNLRAVEEKGGVRLTWQSPDGAAVTGYRIERRRAGGQGSGPQRSHGQPRDHHTLVEDTGNTETSYVDESAEQGVEYEYQVSAHNESGPGEESDWVRAGPEEEPVLGDALPGAPRNLTATPGNREVTLSWDPPDDNGNPPATRYRIEWRVDGKDYDRNDWGTSQETTYTTNAQANLANGVKYFFRVKAENDDGNSYGPYGPSSEEVSSTPTSGSAVDLGTPVLSDTETLHHGIVKLDWQDIEDAGWYVVQYYHVEDEEWLDLPAEGVDIAFHGSSAVVSNLHGLSWLRVGAASCDGASEWSQIEELYGTNASDWEGVPVPDVEEGDEIEPCSEDADTPDNSPATGAPTINGTAQVGETLTANTSEVTDADGLSNVQYEYQWLADDADLSGATNATYTLTYSEESKAIKVQVSFTDDESNEETLTSAATGAVAGAQPTEPPDKPTGLDATASHDSVTLTWDDPVDDSITGYVILRRVPGVDPEGHFNVLVADTATTATTYTDDTVAAETRYTYRIKAINGAGTSERSRWSHIDVPAAPLPDKPTGLEATVTHGQVVLTWDDPQDDTITGYVILRRIRVNDQGGDFDVLVADTGTAALTYTDATVAAGTTYTYRIKAINEHGTSERSRWFHIDIPEAP